MTDEKTKANADTAEAEVKAEEAEPVATESPADAEEREVEDSKEEEADAQELASESEKSVAEDTSDDIDEPEVLQAEAEGDEESIEAETEAEATEDEPEAAEPEAEAVAEPEEEAEVEVAEEPPAVAPVAAAAPEPTPVPDDAEWFVVHAYSGHEDKVRNNLLKRVESMDMHDKIFEVLVPTEEVIEIKDGQRRHVQKRIFPGYILVNMEMTDESWYVVRNTPGVTSFVGSGNKPIPLQPHEIKAIVKQTKAEAPKVKVEYQVGENVRVVDGPFSDFHGKVDEIMADKGKLKVLVNMFGRETPVELDLLQVERLH